jgi:hypothetical protein
MITVASVDYCERCRCKTLHVPTPSGERICEHHLQGGEAATTRPPAPRHQPIRREIGPE